LYFKSEDLNGFAAWFAKQAAEEKVHADKLINHLIDRDASVALASLGSAKTSYKSPAEVFEIVFNLERGTTELIYNLYEAAREEKDYPLEILLQWYISEQVEEEKWTRELAAQIKAPFGFCGSQIYFLDKRWGKRAAGE